MLVVYWRIWREAAGHARRLRATAHNGTPSDWKSVQVKLSRIIYIKQRKLIS